MKNAPLLILVLCCLHPEVSTAQAGPPATGFAIADVQAKLFYSNSGRFSANVLGNDKITLHNVVIGEGGVEGPSDNTLLLVRLQGPPKASIEGLSLRVIGRTEQDTLVDREIEVGRMNTSGNYYAAFWLDDTGCLPVTVEAILGLGKKTQKVTTLIPFECSE